MRGRGHGAAGQEFPSLERMHKRLDLTWFYLVYQYIRASLPRDS